MDAEVWLPVSDFPLYDVSNHGRVRSWAVSGRFGKICRRKKPRILKGSRSTGYPAVYLADNFAQRGRGQAKVVRIHRLVAMAFVPGDHSLQVAHLDGDKTNNHYSNLAWVTAKENNSHMVIHGTRPTGERHGAAKMCDHAVRALLELSNMGMRPSELAWLFGISRQHTTSLLKGRFWKEVTVNGVV